MKRLWQFATMIFLAVAGSMIALPLKAQIAVVRPDVAAPGMSVVLEVLAKSSMPGYFGTDGFEPKIVSCFTRDPSDSDRVKFGPLCISWNGRVLQIPVYVVGSEAGPAPIVIRGQNAFDTIDFRINLPQQLSPLSGPVVLGQGVTGNFSTHNTLVVDQLVANNATITITKSAALEPITILSAGPIVLTNNTKIFVRANGVDGGPGGGGGGSGYQGEGGAGFTGGGNSGVRPPSGNIGSDINDTPTVLHGGPSLTGVPGGGSDPDKDQGGGGGTGCPFGSSGAAGLENANSAAGGYGGGSGGGEANQNNLAYGGGGGGFGTDGQAGVGIGPNNGRLNGGRFLIPLQGGSGGGAGNSEGLANGAGNGGGGGGAIALVGFDSVSIQNSTIFAEGDSGTSGAKNTAGGGGGSGGAVLVSTNVRLSATNFGIQINGGAGGQGGINSLGGNESAGGGGGFGRLRLDGGNPTVNIPLTNIASSVISVQKPATLLLGNWIKLSGFATDNANESDSIRIYYRTNRSTKWSRVDTVRNRVTGTWSKWIPRQFDSLLLVATCIKVVNPSNTTANFEPDLAMSHAGLMIYPEPATPHLASIDTLSFGSERVGQCKTLNLLVKNDGSATLHIDSMAISGKQYSVTPSTGFALAPYTSDTLSITFCPDSAKLIVGALQLFSNDPLSNPKRIVLVGIGTLKNDSLVVTPATVRFDRVVVGHCDSIQIVLRSAGKDTVALLASSWNKPPFTLDLRPADTLLAPGDSMFATLHYCPTDTTDTSVNFVLDAHGDNITAFGHAVIRRLASTADTALDTLCLGHDLVFDLPIRNRGNDTVSILSILTNDPNVSLESSLPILLRAHEIKNASFILKAASLSNHVDTIRYATPDSIIATVLRYTVSDPILAIDSELNFGAICAGLKDTMVLRIANHGSNIVTYSLDTLGMGPTFVSLDTTRGDVGPGIIRTTRFVFSPSTSGNFLYKVLLHATTVSCDSIFSFTLRGVGSTGSLTANDLIFDTTVVGTCREDSILVQNPCGPAQTINAVSVTSPFQYLDSGLQPITVPAGGSAWLHFRFCPDSTGERVQHIQIGAIQVAIKGVGNDTTKPWAAFRISNATIRAGEVGATAMTFDSSSLKGRRSIRVNLLFDPTVVWPESAHPAPATLTTEGVYSFDTTIDFSLPSQSLDVVNWRGLIGPKQSTNVGMSVTPDTLFDVRLHPGTITITDCYNLGGHITPSGPYIIHAIRPSIISSDAIVTVELGNAGRAVGEILDITGRHISTVFDRDFERGEYNIPLNLSGVSSGRYMFVVRSLDWQAMTPFIIDR